MAAWGLVQPQTEQMCRKKRCCAPTQDVAARRELYYLGSCSFKPYFNCSRPASSAPHSSPTVASSFLMAIMPEQGTILTIVMETGKLHAEQSHWVHAFRTFCCSLCPGWKHWSSRDQMGHFFLQPEQLRLCSGVFASTSHPSWGAFVGQRGSAPADARWYIQKQWREELPFLGDPEPFCPYSWSQ